MNKQDSATSPAMDKETTQTNRDMQPRIPNGFKNPVFLTKWLQSFLLLGIIVFGVAIYASGMQYKLLHDAQNGFYISEEQYNADAQANVERMSTVDLSKFCVVIVTVISFFFWIYRANKNARELGNHPMEFTPGWAVGWFFIPFLCLWKPYQVMKEIWIASNDSHDRTKSTGLYIVGLWWTMWLVSNIFGNIFSRSPFKVDDIETLMAITSLSMASLMADLICNVMTLVVISRIFAMQMSCIKNRRSFAV